MTHFRSVPRIATDHKSRCTPRVRQGCGIGDAGSTGEGVDHDIRSNRRSTKATDHVAGGSLHGEVTGNRRVQGRRKLQPRVRLSKRDEVAVMNDGDAVILEQSAPSDGGDPEVSHFNTIAWIASNDEATGCLYIFIRSGIGNARRFRNSIDVCGGGSGGVHQVVSRIGTAQA